MQAESLKILIHSHVLLRCFSNSSRGPIQGQPVVNGVFDSSDSSAAADAERWEGDASAAGAAEEDDATSDVAVLLVFFLELGLSSSRPSSAIGRA
jgi:hypothetical protein